MIFVVVVRSRRFAVLVVADHACLPSSVCVIVAKLAKSRVQAATRSNERMPKCLMERLSFCQLRQSPGFLGGHQLEVNGGRSKGEGRLS